MLDTTSIKKDVFVRFRDGISVVTDFQHVSPGKGSAFVRVKFKNVQTGKAIEHTYKAGESVDVIELDRTNMQYLYKDANNYYFMDQSSYEQVGVSTALVGDKGQFLKEGQEVSVLMNEGQALTIDLPKKLTFKVIEAMPAVKGDTASGNVRKEVTIETGMKLGVPLFINEGDLIIINTETGEYVERAK